MSGFINSFISDNGAGISPEHLAKIFDRFYKINDRSTPDYRGSGLGLSIAQGLVQAQEGAIEVDSQLGLGTQVRFRLPLMKSGISRQSKDKERL